MIRVATKADAEKISFNLRTLDEQEIRASNGGEPHETLVSSWLASAECYVFDSPQHGPTGIWGVVEDIDYGIPWFLGTKLANPRDILRVSKTMLDSYDTRYPLLCNYVDKRNTPSHRYLRWLGFSFLRELLFGVAQLPFYEFVRIAPCASPSVLA